MKRLSFYVGLSDVAISGVLEYDFTATIYSNLVKKDKGQQKVQKCILSLEIVLIGKDTNRSPWF